MQAMRSELVSRLVLVGVLVGLVSACGGDGEGGGGQNGGGVGTPPGTLTSTPTRTPTRTRTLAPGEPTFTPTPTVAPGVPTPTATFIQVSSERGIAETIRLAPPGSLVLVPPGSYGPVTLTGDDVNGPITLLADTFGILGGAEGPVVITSRGGSSSGFLLDGVSGLVIDGFTILGAANGIELRDSSGITIANNVVRNHQTDGLRVLRSGGLLIFNNLIYGNQRTGIYVVGSVEIQVINNTVYGNQAQGISIGDDLLSSESIFLRNNIIHMNRSIGLLVHPATELYDGDYNLNTDGYGVGTPAGGNDLHEQPFYSNPGSQDGFRLPQTTDDCSGGDIAMDAGDPSTDPDLAFLLSELTTQVDNKADCVGAGCCPPGCGAEGAPSCARIGAVDLGFHYPIP